MVEVCLAEVDLLVQLQDVTGVNFVNVVVVTLLDVMVVTARGTRAGTADEKGQKIRANTRTCNDDNIGRE